MRGKGSGDGKAVHAPGITPAYAGKRTPSTASGCGVRDHPRVCGEKLLLYSRYKPCKGSPPRMRGKDHRAGGIGGAVGITPAYAGKRVYKVLAFQVCKDHPRVCGEKPAAGQGRKCIVGSPPRMRGKVNVRKRCNASRGITPAYAGKSKDKTSRPPAFQDHPRVCGEKNPQTIAFGVNMGSPPRMRGKACFFGNFHPGVGITPAYAGKRRGIAARLPLLRDHPRVCGEKR